jgi:hypothetical protein
VADVERVLRHIAEDIRNSYTLGYVSRHDASWCTPSG